MTEDDQRGLLQAALTPFVADVRRTLYPDFGVDLYVEDGWWWWRTTGEAGGTASTLCGTDWEADDAPEDAESKLTAELAYDIPDSAFDDVLVPWPRCPTHGDHPLYPEERAGRAVWVCRQSGGGVVAVVGELGRG